MLKVCWRDLRLGLSRFLPIIRSASRYASVHQGSKICQSETQSRVGILHPRGPRHPGAGPSSVDTLPLRVGAPPARAAPGLRLALQFDSATCLTRAERPRWGAGVVVAWRGWLHVAWLHAEKRRGGSWQIERPRIVWVGVYKVGKCGLMGQLLRDRKCEDRKEVHGDSVCRNRLSGWSLWDSADTCRSLTLAVGLQRPISVLIQRPKDVQCVCWCQMTAGDSSCGQIPEWYTLSTPSISGLYLWLKRSKV